MPESEPILPLTARLWFAWLCFFRVLFDGAFALRAWEAREPKALEPSPARLDPKPAAPAGEGASTTAALQLLALFQREGRLVDFLEQDITSFSDGDVGVVARIVHEGCSRTLREHAQLSPIRDEEEGAPLTLQAGFDPAEIKLSGNLQGAAPYRGVLRHRGWRAARMKLPAPVKGHDATVIAPAEVEL